MGPSRTIERTRALTATPIDTSPRAVIYNRHRPEHCSDVVMGDALRSDRTDSWLVRVLHISDLHERAVFQGMPDSRHARLHLDAEERGLILGDGFRTSLEEIAADGVDFVCLTGDVTDWGVAEEFEKATVRLTSILSAIGVARNRLFAVPGNHDVDRRVHADSWRGLRNWQSGRKETAELGRWMRGVGEAPAGPVAEWRDQVLERTARFWVWLDAFRGEATRTGSHSMLGYRHTITPGSLSHVGSPVHLVGLDSAWLCGDDRDQGQILVTEEQVLAHTRDREQTLDGLRIAMVHHPLEHLGDHHKIRHMLGSGGVDVVLHGHQHEPFASRASEPGSSLTVLAAGCLVEGDDGRNWPNGFQLVELDAGGARRVRLRKWVRQRHFWTVGSDIYPDAIDGVLELPVAWGQPAPLDRPLADASGAGRLSTVDRTSGNVAARSSASPNDGTATGRGRVLRGGLIVAAFVAMVLVLGIAARRSHNGERLPHPNPPASSADAGPFANAEARSATPLANSAELADFVNRWYAAVSDRTASLERFYTARPYFHAMTNAIDTTEIRRVCTNRIDQRGRFAIDVMRSGYVIEAPGAYAGARAACANVPGALGDVVKIRLWATEERFDRPRSVGCSRLRGVYLLRLLRVESQLRICYEAWSNREGLCASCPTHPSCER